MKEINILVLADHAEILETILRLIGNHDNWKGFGAGSAEQAFAAMEKNKFDLVLLGVGVDEETGRQIMEHCRAADPKIGCIRHYGGGSGLLYSEIRHALQTG
ncbi:response regulator receiver protein [Dyadobacter flavalbus]|uniref:Response regulator receiver protein n=1 Tax=Dyadobacter flavalbus TaxID=2579942 RepID=A0A5M8Q9V7_9BACT|nr:response regulator receiver protein [Dyadobacter flavalbus]KAA6432767.1 response regulator receiver protein [Dyadobacter flavalbus]